MGRRNFGSIKQTATSVSMKPPQDRMKGSIVSVGHIKNKRSQPRNGEMNDSGINWNLNEEGVSFEVKVVENDAITKDDLLQIIHCQACLLEENSDITNCFL